MKNEKVTVTRIPFRKQLNGLAFEKISKKANNIPIKAAL